MNIGFQNLEFFTEESTSATVRVCTQIDTGSLEREVTAFLSTTTGGTATGIILDFVYSSFILFLSLWCQFVHLHLDYYVYSISLLLVCISFGRVKSWDQGCIWVGGDEEGDLPP